jgi:putative AdoMet-dependent methyltransferase
MRESKNKIRFDEWAETYDKSLSTDKQGYPFEGYKDVLGFIRNLMEVHSRTKVLDLGVGTGLLTEEAHDKGALIYGTDISTAMLKRAKQKMPKAKLHCCDFSQVLPDALKTRRYDYIVSSYALHHIDDTRKIKLIRRLKKNLATGGKIILADISFKNQRSRAACRKASGEKWDNSEFYIVASSIIKKVWDLGLKAKYHQISSCAGVLEIWA